MYLCKAVELTNVIIAGLPVIAAMLPEPPISSAQSSVPHQVIQQPSPSSTNHEQVQEPHIDMRCTHITHNVSMRSSSLMFLGVGLTNPTCFGGLNNFFLFFATDVLAAVTLYVFWMVLRAKQNFTFEATFERNQLSSYQVKDILEGEREQMPARDVQKVVVLCCA